jgi:hypothetical protein
VNEVQGSSNSAQAADPAKAGQAQSGQQATGNKQESTSKKKQKKGLRKLVPF